MSDKIGQFLEISFVAIVVFLVLSNPMGFSMAVNAVGKNATEYAKTLQGR